jgi:tetratricopeptide (TPR) repeat protein
MASFVYSTGSRNLLVKLCLLMLFMGACQENAASLLGQAKEAMQKDDLESAADLFREVTIQSPESPLAAEALYALAEIHYFNRRDAEAARDLLLKILMDYPTSAVSTEAQRLLARIYEVEFQDSEKALTHYRALLDLAQVPDSRRSTLLSMAECYYGMDSLHDALQTYRQVVELPYHSDTDGAYFRLANLELLVGSSENALEILRQLVAATRDDDRRYDALLSEVEVLTSLGRFPEARESIERLQRGDWDPAPVSDLLVRLRSVELELEHESLDDDAQAALLQELQKGIRWGGGRRRAKPKS